ncbi:methyltransferase domain-containing protein [Streptomyces sp. SID8366]|uniref:class I SAM-dependent methyltransferase n=1 Tax=unclassified Streptomyces TaxID=2593676 RepID=UPI000DB914DF|nr:MULTISPECIES: class I SAM-dependent methyltransferase [unclassified Streptomyces]MYU07885.1 methyltransferase domain-containing protein [Streptomyces sp. SID8366]MYU62225.1 methyltransferase domain-containing protein [Streptomyces sp. SID69]RAJ52226.1 O-methyltransferase [Streptomyces sp. PsTaAH-130]
MTKPATALAEVFDQGIPVLAVLGAQRAGLLAALLERAATAEEFAKDLALDPLATRLTLNVLVHSGAAVHADGRYQASPELAERARNAPGGVELHLNLFGHLPELLLSGKPLLSMDGTLEERGRHYAQVAQGLGHMYPAAAAELAEALEKQPYGLGDGTRSVLDLGAGSGVWSLAAATRMPGVQVTAVDLPPVLEGLRHNAAEAGVGARVTTLEGSYFDVELPAAAHDLVILGNILHLETADDAERLVHRAAAAVKPGGTLAVIDILGSGPYETNPVRAQYALFLAARTSSGAMYSGAEVTDWLTEAGLTGMRTVELLSAPPHFTCLTAVRPR